MASSAIIMPQRHHGWPVSTRSGAFPQYQGGSSFTVFSAQGSNPTSNCKVCGKSVQKIYDKSVKGYVYNCAGGMSSKLQWPKDDSRSGLQLLQPYLVLQIFVPQGQHFSFELRVTDTTNTRRKMYFSTSFSELKTTPLHSQIPLSMVLCNTWLSLAIHVSELFDSCFRVMSFRSVDVIILGAVCKIRKIFTMRNRLAESPGHALGNEEWLPPEHMFATGVDASIQVLDAEKLHILGVAINLEGRREGVLESVASARTMNSNRLDRPVHIAFGSRVPLPLSALQINTNLSCDDKLPFPKDRKLKAFPSATKKYTGSGDFKGSELVNDCGDGTVTIASMKQTRTKRLDLGAIDSSEALHDSLTFPIQEEPYTITEIENIICGKHAHSAMTDVKKGIQMSKRKDLQFQEEYQDASTVETDQKDVHAEAMPKQGRHSENLDPTPERQGSTWEETFNVGQCNNFLSSQHSSEKATFSNPEKLPLEMNPLLTPFDQSFGGTSFEDSLMDDSDDCYSANSEHASSLIEQDWSSLHFSKEKQSKPLDVKDANKNAVGKGQCYILQEDIALKEKLAGSHKEGNGVKGEDVTLKRSLSSTEDFWIVHEEDDLDEDKCTTDSNPRVSNCLARNIPEDTSSVVAGNSDFATSCLSSPLSKKHLPSGLSRTQDGFAKIKCSPSKSEISSHNQRQKDLFQCEPYPNTENDDMHLDLLYDPLLDCYYDPKTNRYYELK